jgi:hypothetical protein
MVASDQENSHSVIIALPASLDREIGRVIVAWACFEWHLTQATHLLIGVGPQTGQLAIREPRVADRINMIRELVEHLKVPITFDFKNFAAAAGELAARRDWLAHGIWVHHKSTGTLLLRITKGTWERPSSEGKTVKASRRLYPQGQAIGAEHLRILRAAIEEMIARSDELVGQVRASVEASPPKRP